MTKKDKDTEVAASTIKEIQASAKISMEINKIFYTIQYSETRTVSPECNIKKERQQLEDAVYNEVYRQIDEISSLQQQ